MNKKELIDNIYIGINKIGNYSYENFLKSFNFSKKDYSKATEFETRISSLFYFDYCISGKRVNQEFRQKFYKICTEKIRNHYADYFENKNLLDIIDYRYNEYAKIPISIGENWMQSFNNLYEIKLKGTENVKFIEELPAIKMEDGFQDMPLKMKFIQGEVKNAYRTAKLVDDLFNGKTIYEALYELEQIDSKPNPDEGKMNADIDDISELMNTGKIKKTNMKLRINDLDINLKMSLDRNELKLHKIKKPGLLGSLFIKKESGETIYWTKNCNISCFDDSFTLLPNLDTKSESNMMYGTSAYLFYKNNVLIKVTFQLVGNELAANWIFGEFQKSCSDNLGNPIKSNNTITWSDGQNIVIAEKNIETPHAHFHWLIK